MGLLCLLESPSMTANITTRQASLDDIDILVPLFDAYRVFYQQPADPALAHAFLHERMALRESVIFLAESGTHERSASGFTQLYPGFSSVSARRLWILNDLFVLSDARGRGVGRALLERARTHARRTGACRVTLSTAADNRNAQALYEDVGFQRDGDFFYTLAVD
jgi:GNAT superfamily N-acetyltransferase